MDKEKIKDFKETLRKSSFKVKPILLELQNYSFFHSVQNKDQDDINKRFIGRKEIIKRLRSFVNDTAKNTGTYLVSGFRGMGKTSAVNKALSSFNTKSNIESFIRLWFFLLPITFFLNEVTVIFSDFNNIPFWAFFIFVFLVFIFYLGHRDPRRERINKHKFKKTYLLYILNIILKKLRYGFTALLNPKFKKHKYTFHGSLRSLILYAFSLIFFLSYYSFCKYTEEPIDKSHFFWLITNTIFLWYLMYDSYIEIIKYLKRKKYKSKDYKNIWLVFMFLLFGIIVFLHYIKCIRISNYTFNIFSVVIYFGLKLFLKYDSKKEPNRSPRNTLKRIITFFDLQHYIIVKVNLGKDNLTEKDVLKYITNELFNEYRKWYYNVRCLKRFGNMIFLFLLIYLGSTVIYRTFLGNEFKRFSIDQYKIAYFFPSQGLLSIEDNLTSDKIDLLFSKNGKDTNISNYIKEISCFLKDSSNRVGYKNLINKQKYRDELRLSANDKYEIEYQTDFNKVLVKFGMFCNEIDYLTLRLWHKTRCVIINEQVKIPLIENSSENNSVKSIISKAYPKVPALTVFIIMFALVTSYRFIPNRFLLIKTHYYFLRELKKLKDEINASIVVEKGGGANGVKSSFLNYFKKISYSPLESKDITQKLIHILDDISEVNLIFTKIRLIFVFDELDKINSNDNTVISNLEDEFDNDKNEVRYQARRKERISRILSSMKHFLNSAHAKFIFIAGRDMYDAALAGISDRESSLDSIFNDNKIYVNSFYTEGEDKSLKDITSTTEHYLCQFLLPEYYLSQQTEEPSITLYNQYLIEEIEPDHTERVKIILTLKDFVVFLAYRSNGAPRKLSSLIEQYIKPKSQHDLIGDEGSKSIVVGSNDENLFLELGYYHQYKFNFISYLTSPIFLGLGNYIHEYSDKLLVSISYILDHLFKHHKFGLSHRSLTLTPEIVDINKEPQFREFLDKLISFLSKNHLRPIVSGIYDYKFHGKIQTEIKFLSKIDELEAAAFNFTLDESIELKRHFNRRLESLKAKEAEIIINNKDGYVEDYVNNISLLHMMIGDLHFYDEEFHEAIVHYMDAIQILRQKDIKEEMTLYEFVVFVRNNLKLGLAFEKNSMYDSALMTYSELTDLILLKRNIPLRKIGLARFILKKSDINKTIWNTIFDNHEIKTKIIELFNYKKEIVVIGRLNEHIVKGFKNDETFEWKKLYPIEDMITFYSVNESDIIKNIESVDTNYQPLKTYYAQSTGESIRVLYQSLIAKLHLIEKTSPDRLKSIDLIRAIKEFNFLKYPLKTAEKRVIVAEFYNKIGDLLYFKNGTLNRNLRIKLFGNIDNNRLKKESKLLLTSPLDSTLFYIKSLAVLLKPNYQNNDDTNIDIINLIDYYEKEKDLYIVFNSVRKNLDNVLNKIKVIVGNDSFRQRYTNDYLFSIASGILDLAESLLSYTKHKIKETHYTVPTYIQYIYNSLNIEFVEVLNLYHYASIIFEKTGEYRLARSQKIKILYILNQCSIESIREIITLNLDYPFPPIGNCLIFKFLKLEDFIEHCKALSYRSINNSAYLDNKKVMRLTDDENLDEFGVDYMESFETETIYYHIVNKFLKIKLLEEERNKIFTYFFKTDKQELENKLKSFIEGITPYNNVVGKNNRLLVLSTLVQYNKNQLKESGFIFEKTKETEEKFKIEDRLSFTNSEEFIILNSIGACNEIIKILNLFGLNYVSTSNFTFAKAHYQMAFWCDKFEELKSKIKDKDTKGELIETLKEILDSKSIDYLKPIYHYELALEYNNKIIDFHTRGASLQDFISSYSYLDDFYNDNFVHFSIAIERNKYLEGDIDVSIKKIKDKISKN